MADRVRYRRAYGRSESLKGIEAVLWKHGVRPVANLIVDKVTTDGALVIDAVEAVCTNEIDTVAICSGDADFVPLAIWLREKGCRVLCYSLAGKLFANPESFYDDVVVLEVVAPVGFPSSGVSPNATNSLMVKELPAKSKETQPLALATQPVAVKVGAAKPSLQRILAALPELKDRQALHLSIATQKLKKHGLLGKNASSPPLFRQYGAQFELMPKVKPNQVRYRGETEALPPSASGAVAEPALKSKPAVSLGQEVFEVGGIKTPRSVYEPLSEELHAQRVALWEDVYEKISVADVLSCVPELVNMARRYRLADVAGRLRADGLLSPAHSAMKILRKFPDSFDVELQAIPAYVRYCG